MSVAPLFADFAGLIPARGTLAGLDLGTKTIGIAVSDPDRRMAAPLTTIRRTRFTADVEQLLALAAQRQVVALVLGLPLNMNGSEGPRAQSTRAFARNLAQRTPLPIGFWDERLSSFAAEDLLAEAGLSRAQSAVVVDRHAAAIILDGALDRLRTLAASGRPSADR
jgi:putative Holliday junction resolvase